VAFARCLQYADVFISGSTGPLHIAGALDCRTAAFYPRRRSASALRWQTTNSPDRRLAFSPPDSAEEGDMGAIDVDTAADEIATRFLAA
jgi:ADP-heptose:LPS heptosyltransferase